MESSISEDHWSDLVELVEFGKRVGGALYIHAAHVPDELHETINEAKLLAGGENLGAVVKLRTDRPVVSFLDYPGFDEEAFPRLHASTTIDLVQRTVSTRRYAVESNQPVLHRKELLLPAGHPDRSRSEALSAEVDRLGLLSDASALGYAWQWEEELRARGLRVDGHRLVARRPEDDPDDRVARHKTALSRNRLSSPMQALWRHGFLDAPPL